MPQRRSSQSIPICQDQSEDEAEELNGLGQEPVESVSSQMINSTSSTHHCNGYRVGEGETNTSPTDNSVIGQLTPQRDKTNDNLNHHNGEDEVQWDLELMVDFLETMGPWECSVLRHAPTET